MSESGLAAVFVDRDGTIIEDTHYPRDPDLVEMLPGAIEGLRQMKAKGYEIFVVSNQSGVGRGIISDEQFVAVHERVCELLQKDGVEIREFAYCLHHPDDPCGCRKPKPGLVIKQFQGRPIDFGRSFVVGDRPADLELGKAVGAKAFLVLTGSGEDTLQRIAKSETEKPHEVCKTLQEVAALLPNV